MSSKESFNPHKDNKKSAIALAAGISVLTQGCAPLIEYTLPSSTHCITQSEAVFVNGKWLMVESTAKGTCNSTTTRPGFNTFPWDGTIENSPYIERPKNTNDQSGGRLHWTNPNE